MPAQVGKWQLSQARSVLKSNFEPPTWMPFAFACHPMLIAFGL
jgi:hypothetical protein